MSKIDVERSKSFVTNLILVCALFLVTYVGIRYDSSQIVVIVVESVLIVLSLCFVLSLKKHGFGPMVPAIMGCLLFILIVLIPVNIPATAASLDPMSFTTESISERVAHIKEKREVMKEYGHYIGLLNLGVGMVLAYRPSLLHVKNRLPDGVPYPIWNSKTQSMTKFSPNLVPVKSLLSEKEKMIIFRYKFVLVSIDNRVYLVSPEEKVPETAILLRSKSGQSPLGS